MLIEGGRLADGSRCDVRTDGGRISLVGARLERRPGEEVLEVGGGTVLPGLHDHHIHLRAVAAAMDSIRTGPPEVRDAAGFADVLRRADREYPAGAWLRGIGYHESVAGDLDRRGLDAVVGRRPVRIQHAGGSLWVLNSAALAAIGADGSAPAGVERDGDGRPTGRIWREDRWLAGRLPARGVDLAAVGRAAARWGVTGFTDATPHEQAEDLVDLVQAAASGEIPQRLHLFLAPGVRPGPTGKATIGAVKVVLDDERLPTLDGLGQVVRDAHRDGRAIAVHCVTRVQAVLALAAIEMAGSRRGDRIEHGAVLGPDQLDTLRRLGLTVVTQPGFVWDRGDRYLRDVDLSDQPDLWRLRSLLEAGVGLAASTDAPYGHADPWVAIRAATTRRTRDSQVLGADERIDGRTALALFAGRAQDPTARRRIGPGQLADICILGSDLEAALHPDGDTPVAATVVDGRVVYRRHA